MISFIYGSESSMKIRTASNSIRLRLRKSELDTLRETESISESLTFSNRAMLKTTLFINHKVTEPEVILKDNAILVGLPPQIALDWINSDQVGIERNIQVSEDADLHLLIEKDFPCLDRPNEDKSDTFWELAAEKDANSC